MFHLPKTWAFALLISLIAATPSLALDSGRDKIVETSGWRQKLGTFRVGIVGGNRAMLETRRAQPFRKALQQALGMPVEIYTTPNLAALIEAQTQSRVEYAVNSALSFATTNLLCKCTEPLAVASDFDGSIAFRSVLFAREGKFSSLDQARELSILVPGKTSFSGFGLPNFLIAGTDTLPGLDGWNLVTFDSAEKVTAAFSKGKADGFFGWESVRTGSGDTDTATSIGSSEYFSQRETDVAAVWKSGPVPYGPHSVSKALNAEAKSILRKFLKTLHKDNPVAYEAIETQRFGGFVSVTDADFDLATRYVQSKMQSRQHTVAASVTKPSDIQTK